MSQSTVTIRDAASAQAYCALWAPYTWGVQVQALRHVLGLIEATLQDLTPYADRWGLHMSRYEEARSVLRARIELLTPPGF